MLFLSLESVDFEVDGFVALGIGSELVVLTGKDGIEDDTHDGGHCKPAERGESEVDGVIGPILDADGEHQNERRH